MSRNRIGRFARHFGVIVVALSLALIFAIPPAHARTGSWSIWTSPVQEKVTLASWTTSPDEVSIRILFQRRTYSNSVGVKAVRCSGGDLGPWVNNLQIGRYYTLVSVIGDGVCFKLKFGRSGAATVGGLVYY